LCIVSQNIRGTQGLPDPDAETRDLGKLEVLAYYMSKNKIDIYLVQETWETGTWTRIIHDVTVIHHGPAAPSRNKGGVAVLLGPRAARAWTQAGRPAPHFSGPLAGDSTRYLSVELLFKPRRKQPTRIFVASAYAPQSGIVQDDPETLVQFHRHIDQHLRTLPPDAKCIIGGDWNASVGIRDDPSDAAILGPWGLPHTNDAGERVLELARDHHLRVADTFFQSKNYATFFDLLHDRAPRRLDYFLTSQSFGQHLVRAGVYKPHWGIDSDHFATRLTIRLNRHLR
jgi:exonuclease III